MAHTVHDATMQVRCLILIEVAGGGDALQLNIGMVDFFGRCFLLSKREVDPIPDRDLDLPTFNSIEQQLRQAAT